MEILDQSLRVFTNVYFRYISFLNKPLNFCNKQVTTTYNHRFVQSIKQNLILQQIKHVQSKTQARNTLHQINFTIGYTLKSVTGLFSIVPAYNLINLTSQLIQHPLSRLAFYAHLPFNVLKHFQGVSFYSCQQRLRTHLLNSAKT